MVERGNGTVFAHSSWQIMKVCPHCGNQIPDDNSNIYCPYCNYIANEEVLLRMKIEKQLRKPEDDPKKPLRNKRRYDDDDFDTVKVSDDRSPLISAAISVAVIAAVIAVAYFLLK